MKVAVVHDWLTGMRGGEKVLEVFCRLFPRADIFTLVHIPGAVSAEIESHNIFTSFINRLPWAWRRHQVYLPLFPAAIESFDLSAYDLVLSSSHCVAKGAIVGSGALHLCYCYTPMRYAWEFSGLYREAAPGFIAKTAFSFTLNYLRMWDVASAHRPMRYIAISRHVRRRIARCYGIDSSVIHPPIDTSFFKPSGGAPKDYWLVLSAMVPYKRLDLAIKAFNGTGRKLHVVGDGAGRRRLEAMAGPNIVFKGWLPPDKVREELQGCRALIFPGEEDFGITPLEANACGRPVLAYGRGGVLETQKEGVSAEFFDRQEPGALLEALERLDRLDYDSRALAEHAGRFSTEVFSGKIRRALDDFVEVCSLNDA